MNYVQVRFALIVGTFAGVVALAGAQSLAVETAHGSIEKADKDTVTVQTRGTGGQFGKKLVLKLTGTSKLAAVALEKRGGKAVPVQRDIQPTELEPGQSIAVIYTSSAEPVLLSAILQRGIAKK